MWFGAAAPNAGFYATEVADVQQKGALTGHTRNAKETVAGIFWAYDGTDKLGTPPRLYCQIAFKILDTLAMTNPAVQARDYVRLFALIGTAMADSGIQAWYWKYHYDLWRPVIGIREADACIGPGATVGGAVMNAVPDWAPLGAPDTNFKDRFTPPFPAYPSGHATFGTAAFQVLRRYFEHRGFKANPGNTEKDTIAFDFMSEEYDGHHHDADGSLRPGIIRHFDSLWDATVENSISRVFLGVHWRFDGITRKGPGNASVHAAMGVDKPGNLGNIGGVKLGRRIANNLMNNGLKSPP